MFIYIFFLAVGLVSHINAMSDVIILKDNQNNPAVTTDAKILQELNTLSHWLTAQPLEEITEENKKKYVVLTKLPKKLLLFLLQLNANKTQLFVALANQAIAVNDLTRSEVRQLQLSDPYNTIFDNVLIIETTKDNLYATINKNIASRFFTILDNFIKEFNDQFIISVSEVKKPDLATLFQLVHDLPDAESFKDWATYVQIIKERLKGKQPAALFTLLEAANFLGAKSFVLTALFETYKDSFLKSTDWQQQLQLHPFLEDIAYDIENIEYLSIAQLLKQGKKDFYSVKMETNVAMNKDILTARISSPNICFLRGLNTIPEITKCESLIVENTQIATLKTNDLDNLASLTFLYFKNNQNLSILEKKSLRKFNLVRLEFNDSNINILPSDVFLLPNLVILKFYNNHIKEIETNWAKNLSKLTTLILNEPELTVLEPGWLTGAKSLRNVELSPKVKLEIRKQIEQDSSIGWVDESRT